MKRLLFILSLFLTVGSVSNAQNAELDSLISAEKSYRSEDTVKLELLTKICDKLHWINPQLQLEYCNKTKDLAERLYNPRSKIIALYNLGFIYQDLFELEKALPLFISAYELSKQTNDTLLIIQILNGLGACCLRKSDYNQAIEYFNQAIGLCNFFSKCPDLYSGYNNLGTSYMDMGNYILAQKYYLLALNEVETCDDKQRMAQTYHKLGILYKRIKDFNKSQEYLLKAIKYNEIGGNELTTAIFKSTLASIYIYLNDPEQSIKTNFEILPILKKYKSWPPYYISINNIGHTLIQINSDSVFNYIYRTYPFQEYEITGRNQYEVAISCVQKIVDYNISTGAISNLSLSYGTISKAYMYLENYPDALKYCYMSLKMADSVRDPSKRKNALYRLSDIYEHMKEYDSAYFYYKEMIAQRDSIESVEIKNQIARKEAEYEFSIKEKDLLHQKELSDVAAASANTELQRQLLLTRTREQEILLKDRALQIGQKEKEMQHLAYLKKMAELDVVKLEKQDKDKQLSLTKQSFALQNLKLSKRELERNLLIVGVALSLLSIFLIFRNYRNQRKSNLKQQELNSNIRWANKELNHKNTKLAETLDDLKQMQAQLVETEKQKETEVIRRRIAQDIHDDISSGLTRIAWLSELAREKAKNGQPADADNALEKILASSRETVDRLGEIIWAVNPDRDNLEGFFAYLRTYIAKFFEDTGFEVTLDFPGQRPELRFSPELKRTLFLVVKEALHNVAKHSKAGQVAVAFHCPDHRYSITITDDGKGFDVAATQLKGNGLKNMQKRMESVGGKIEIESQPEKGTVVNLTGEVYN